MLKKGPLRLKVELENGLGQALVTFIRRVERKLEPRRLDSKIVHDHLLVSPQDPQLLVHAIVEELDRGLDGGLIPPPLFVRLTDLGHLLNQAILGDLEHAYLPAHNNNLLQKCPREDHKLLMLLCCRPGR